MLFYRYVHFNSSDKSNDAEEHRWTFHKVIVFWLNQHHGIKGVFRVPWRMTFCRLNFSKPLRENIIWSAISIKLHRSTTHFRICAVYYTLIGSEGFPKRGNKLENATSNFNLAHFLQGPESPFCYVRGWERLRGAYVRERLYEFMRISAACASVNASVCVWLT